MLETVQNLFYPPILPIFLLTFILWKFVRPPYGIPPGPTAWPILGNLLMFRGKDKRCVFGNLREKYGDIFSVYFGNRLVVVLNGYELIHEALVKNSDVFTGRPHLLLRQQLCGKHGLINIDGEEYKNHRKFIQESLIKFGLGQRSIGAKIEEEVRHCLDLIDKSDGTPVDPKSFVSNCVANVTCSIIFGERFEHDNPEFLEWLNVTDAIFKKSGSASILNYVPILQYLPGDLFQIHALVNRFQFVKQFIHTRYMGQKGNLESGEASNFCDAYCRESRKRLQRDPGTSFTDEQAVMVVSDLFAGSMETTATSILWAFVFLTRHPDIQDRMRKEIDSVVGRSELPTWEDSEQLPFTEATIMEIQRCGDVVPFALAHAVSSDVNFRGYKLPRHTIVIPFLHSVLNDSQVWKNPDQFDPTRFLDATGKVEKPRCFIPFGAGPRKCLGESIAKKELFLFLTSIVQQYIIAPPENDLPPLLEGFVGLTHMPKPFRIRFISRLDV